MMIQEENHTWRPKPASLRNVHRKKTKNSTYRDVMPREASTRQRISRRNISGSKPKRLNFELLHLGRKDCTAK